MVNVSLGEAFNSSVEWTKTIFVRPFSFKKWVILYIIAMLAFELQGGLNLRFNNTSRGPAKEARTTQGLRAAVAGAPANATSTALVSPIAKETFNKHKPLFIGLGILLVLLVLFMWWLRSVFLFVFLEAIVHNDASIRGPFGRNVRLGNSYFGWSLLFTVLYLGVFAVPVKLGYDILSGFGVFSGNRTAPFGTILLSVLPHIFIILAVLIIGGLIGFFFEDYVSLVMYKKRISLPKAVSPASGLVFSSFWTTMKYIFIKIGLALAIAITSAVISFLVLITFLSPVILIGFVLGFLYHVIPTPVRTLFFVILAISGVPIIVAIIFVINVIFTPLAVFFRTFNMKFIARLDEKCDLFNIA